ncbi:MAG TPA: hypothetical protein VNO14_14940, partial [Blastocatellia bacterium]|nr:hypothetical protein [Blastocatellia bacterium]
HKDYRSKGKTIWESRPRNEREVYAHQYADRMREKLRKEGVLPFERFLNLRSLKKDGLLIDDFRTA